MNVFDEIYKNDSWSGGSGPGSDASANQPYMRFVEKFIRKERISRVVDVGCGDWQFSRLMNWYDADYEGFDVAESVISNNQVAFGGGRISFRSYSGDFTELPQADLLICKDVLQHLSNSKVCQFVDILPKFKFALITNCVDPKLKAPNNDEIRDGDFRYLDLRDAPFHVVASEVLDYGPTAGIRSYIPGFRPVPIWRKKTLLIQSING
jgi:hypothetical protein